jgi:hypothetical protein
MSALPAAAAAIGSGFLAGVEQFAVSLWVLVPLGVAVLMGAAIWWLGRRSLRMPLVPLPPAEEAGDGTLDIPAGGNGRDD